MQGGGHVFMDIDYMRINICILVTLFPYQIEYPVVWSVDEFCDGFFKLIDHLELDRVSPYFSAIIGCCKTIQTCFNVCLIPFTWVSVARKRVSKWAAWILVRMRCPNFFLFSVLFIDGGALIYSGAHTGCLTGCLPGAKTGREKL